MVELAPVPSDTKDWTWVLQTRCPDCGFDASAVDVLTVGVRIRAAADFWRARLAASDAAERPAPQVWSVLEYGAHVRDVCRIFTVRATLMLDNDDPVFANWDQDETALTERYWAQDPGLVAIELASAAEALAQTFDTVPADGWRRTGHRDNGSDFSLDSLARYFLHDLDHHAWDVSATPA